MWKIGNGETTTLQLNEKNAKRCAATLSLRMLSQNQTPAKESKLPHALIFITKHAHKK